MTNDRVSCWRWTKRSHCWNSTIQRPPNLSNCGSSPVSLIKRPPPPLASPAAPRTGCGPWPKRGFISTWRMNKPQLFKNLRASGTRFSHYYGLPFRRDDTMPAWNPQANDIFLAALERASPEQRKAYIDEACQGQEELRRQVKSLLAASEEAGSFLEAPHSAVAIDP